jgi:hypothetical protein
MEPAWCIGIVLIVVFGRLRACGELRHFEGAVHVHAETRRRRAEFYESPQSSEVFACVNNMGPKTRSPRGPIPRLVLFTFIRFYSLLFTFWLQRLGVRKSGICDGL